MPKDFKCEEDLNKIGRKNWKEYSELSDTRSDSWRNSIFTRDIEDSSNDKLRAEERHREKVLSKLKEQETAIEKAREETKDRADKIQLWVFISTTSRAGIPVGTVVKPTYYGYGVNGKCKVHDSVTSIL